MTTADVCPPNARDLPPEQQRALSYQNDLCTFLQDQGGYAAFRNVYTWGLRQRPPLTLDFLSLMLDFFRDCGVIGVCERGEDEEYYFLPGHEPPTVIPDEKVVAGSDGEPEIVDDVPDEEEDEGAQPFADDEDDEPVVSSAPPVATPRRVRTVPVGPTSVPVLAPVAHAPIAATSTTPDLRQASGLMLESMSPEALLAWAQRAADVKRLQAQLDAARLSVDEVLVGHEVSAPAPTATTATPVKTVAKTAPPTTKAATATKTATKAKADPSEVEDTIMAIVRAAKGKPVDVETLDKQLSLKPLDRAPRAASLVRRGFLVRQGDSYVLGKAAS